MPITQDMIAKKLGINQRTVSIALGASGRINADTRRLIIETAEQMGYRPNRLAAGLRGARTGSIGVIWTFVDPWAGDAIIGLDILRRLQERGWATYQAQYDESNNVLCQRLDDFIDRRVDAIIIRTIPSQLREPEVIKRLARIQAVVAVSRESDDQFAGDLVIHDRNEAIRQVVRHLAQSGRRRITMALDIKEESNPPKFEVFQDECRRCGIDNHPHLLMDLGHISGADTHGQMHLAAFRRMFPSGNVDIDAVFCFNDIGALYLMRELEDRKIQIPQQIAVVGFNDTEAGRLWRPALATGDRRHQDVVEAVDRLLAERIAQPDRLPQRQTVPMRFVWRESAG